MATQQRPDLRTARTDGAIVTPHGAARTDGPVATRHDEPHVRELLKQLATEGSDLMRNEMALAKLEMRQMAREVALDSAKLAASIGLSLAGALALLAAAIIGLGHVIGYGLSALIIGAVILLIGGLLARGGIAGLRDMPKTPEQTVRSMQQNKDWASRELKEFKEEIRS